MADKAPVTVVPLEQRDPATLTRYERNLLAKKADRAEATKQRAEARKADRVNANASRLERLKAEVAIRNGTEGGGVHKNGLSTAEAKAALYRAPLPDDVRGKECPDPSSPDAHKALYAAYFRRMWAVAIDERTTVDNVIQGYTAARISAGVGREAPTPSSYPIRMDSLLGGAKEDEGE